MRTDQLDFALDEDLVATYPTEERDGARMMVLEADGAHRDDAVRNFVDAVPSGAVLVLNDTRVIPARLLGTRMSGGKVELLLLEKLADEPNNGVRWRAMGRGSKPLRPESRLTFGNVEAHIVQREGAVLEVRFWSSDGTPIAEALERAGQMPLPPYIAKRRAPAQPVVDPPKAGDPQRGIVYDDAHRYQTVFAKHTGAVAAPTAGLHLTEAMLEQLRARGVHVVTVTLHVGLGTFQPVTVDDLDEHPMHSERYVIPEATATAIAAAQQRGAPVIAVGTTVVRALESAAGEHGLTVGAGETRLLIQPGYRFRVVDRLLTNFHLPKSTLLALVYAFAGTERIQQAYARANAERYRFFSYGDCMYIAYCSSKAHEASTESKAHEASTEA